MRPSSRPIWWFFALALVLPVTLAAALDASVLDASVLRVGEAVQGSVSPGAEETFVFEAARGEYLRLRLEQRGIDVVLRLYGPDGSLSAEVDGPGGRWVEERLSTLTPKAGHYRVEIAAAPDEPAAGTYELVLEELRAAVDEDGRRLEADDHFHRGRHLRQATSEPERRAAVDAFRQAADLYRGLSDPRGEADAVDQLGGVFLMLGDVETAQDHFELALPLYELADHAPGIADTENDLGITLSRLGERAEAEKRFHRALGLWRELDDLEGQSIVTESLGVLHYRQGDLPKARARLEESLGLSAAAGDRPGQISTLSSLGVIYGQLGDVAAAVDGHQRALALIRETGDRHREPQLLYNIAAGHRVLGELQEALDGYRRALPLARQLGQRDIEHKTLMELAETYRSLGRPEEALEMLEGLDGEPAWVQIKKGWLAQDLGRADRAGRHFQKALDLSRGVEDRRKELQSLIGLVWSLHAEGRLTDALARQRDALAMSRELGDRVTECDALLGGGEILLSSGLPDEALAAVEQALVLGIELGDPTREAMIRIRLADVLRRLGRLEDARSEAENALAEIESARGALIAPDLRASFGSGRYDHHELYIELLMELGDTTAALEATERARARGLVELLAESRVQARAGLDEALAGKERDASRRVSGIQSRLIRELSSTRSSNPEGSNPGDSKSVERLRQALEQARAERDAVEEEIRRRHPRYLSFRYPKSLGVREMQSLLAPDAALLVYSQGHSRSFLFVLKPDGLTAYDLAPAGDIAPRVERFLSATSSAPSRRLQGRLKQASRTLYQQLVAPAADALEGVRMLVIVPDRELHHLPFEALASDDRALVDHHVISYAPSASVLAVLDRTGKGNKGNRDGESWVGIAQSLGASPSQAQQTASRISESTVTRTGRLFDAWDPRPLPGAADEVRSIAALFSGSGTAWVGDGVHETKIKNDPAVRRARILHIAAHGLIDDREPSYSGLLLGAEPAGGEDGLLQVHEIFGLRLNAELVVLSACETGLGRRLRGEGMLGMSRAFFYAGSQALVVSLWPAADDATSELMQAFYRHLQAGKGKAAALAEAKRELRQGQRYAHPFYWAPFVLVGDPD